jgi:hypothetical protein
VSHAALELVWLRRARAAGRGAAAPVQPVILRLAIHPAFLFRWNVETRHGVTPSARPSPLGIARHDPALPMTREPAPAAGAWLSRRQARAASPAVAMPPGFRSQLDLGLAHGVTWRRGRVASDRRGHAYEATPVTDARPRSVLPLGFGLPLTVRATRLALGVVMDGGDDAPAARVRGQMRRVEARAVAPPPIVTRASGREPARPAASAAPAHHAAADARLRGGWEADTQFGWATATPGAPRPAVTPAMVATLTDQVMRQMNERVRAKRERMGKV